jgi:hypothetical protein
MTISLNFQTSGTLFFAVKRRGDRLFDGHLEEHNHLESEIAALCSQ